MCVRLCDQLHSFGCCLFVFECRQAVEIEEIWMKEVLVARSCLDVVGLLLEMVSYKKI